MVGVQIYKALSEFCFLMIYFFVFHDVRAWANFTKYILGFYWTVGTASQAKLLAKYNRCSINYDSVDNNIQKSKQSIQRESICVYEQILFYDKERHTTEQQNYIKKWSNPFYHGMCCTRIFIRPSTATKYVLGEFFSFITCGFIKVFYIGCYVEMVGWSHEKKILESSRVMIVHQ